MKPKILSRSEHNVSRASISKNALKVLYKLNSSGYAGYLVGGGVRDILTGLHPKDFDIATDATPAQVRKLFRNSRIIGRRFQLVHVIFGRDVIEVATFRAAHSAGDGGLTGDGGRILRDNVFGSIEEDAIRRDFTVNALYYNIADFSVVDYVGGLDDIDRKTFRIIGEPVSRFEEDPVRIIRAARLSAKLGFKIDDETAEAMYECTDLLSATPPARMFDEVLKLFQGGYALASFERLIEYELLDSLFPATAGRLEQEPDFWMPFLRAGLENTDRRVQQDLPITPAYLLAFLMWPRVAEHSLERSVAGVNALEAIRICAEELMRVQSHITSIPRRFSQPMLEIWELQPKLEQYGGGRALELLELRRFRAAYDFLGLRSIVQPSLKPCFDWWTEIQEVDGEEREQLLPRKPVVTGSWPGGKGKRRGSGKKSAGRRRRRRRSSRASGQSSQND